MKLLLLVLPFLFVGKVLGADEIPASLTGAKGELNEKEGVFKVNVPRTDLTVTAAGVKMTPPMGLTSWAAFQPVGTQTMVMGDIVLLEDQERTLWDQEEIAEGAELLERALAMRSPGPYQTQAAISASQAP